MMSVGCAVGQMLATNGLRHVFAVPGDFNLLLLDDIIANEKLHYVGCCNELNAGFAADGYARKNGFAALVVTYMVGGLSTVISAAASNADDLPILYISGGPNTHDESANHLIHHTIGEHDIYQQHRCYQGLGIKTFIIKHIENVVPLMNDAVYTCRAQKRPVYLEIACNLISQDILNPMNIPAMFPTFPPENKDSSVAALKDVFHAVQACTNSLLVGGEKVRGYWCENAFMDLSKALGCPVALLSGAKGIFPEENPQFIGTHISFKTLSNFFYIITYFNI